MQEERPKVGHCNECFMPKFPFFNKNAFILCIKIPLQVNFNLYIDVGIILELLNIEQSTATQLGGIYYHVSFLSALLYIYNCSRRRYHANSKAYSFKIWKALLGLFCLPPWWDFVLSSSGLYRSEWRNGEGKGGWVWRAHMSFFT